MDSHTIHTLTESVFRPQLPNKPGYVFHSSVHLFLNICQIKEIILLLSRIYILILVPYPMCVVFILTLQRLDGRLRPPHGLQDG